MDHETVLMGDNVVDVTAQLKERAMVERFARLMGIVQKQDAEIAKDPRPFLTAASRRMALYEERLEQMRRLLWPMATVRDWAPGESPRFHDLREDAFDTISALRRLIDEPLDVPRPATGTEAGTAETQSGSVHEAPVR